MKEMISDKSFKLMTLIMKVMEAVHPHARDRAESFGIIKGSTIVDYACGPGRYTMEFAKLAGEQGKVFAVDIKEMALKEVERKAKVNGMKNIKPILAKGYDSAIDSETADMVIVLDAFFMIENKPAFLNEIGRICKNEGILIIDGGHQIKAKTKRQIEESGIWMIIDDCKDHFRCKKVLNP